jgi:hypothetical protein
MSDLLNKASLVVIPSGYKEDTVYSVVPSDGSGDLSFTRASNGTRVNSAGLFEVTPWNLIPNSQTFASWAKVQISGSTVTVTDNFVTAPNGTLTGAKVVFSTFDTTAQIYQDYTLSPTQVLNTTLYAKVPSGTKQAYFGFFDGVIKTQLKTLTTEWQRIEYTGSVTAGAIRACWFYGVGAESNVEVHLWGGQLNIGSTAKPYFPTTDRLNVPRLTYQNGGGGCPSLLLEKQSTNGLYPSEDFSTTWNLFNSATITTNQATSPDGTQNADKLTTTNSANALYNVNDAGSSAGDYTASIFVKPINNNSVGLGMTNDTTGEAFVLINVATGVGTTTSQTGWSNATYTWQQHANGWYRITITATKGSSGAARFILKGNSSSDYYIWGAQIELGNYPTSYIPTTTASATRVADACFKTGISSLIGQTEGVMFWDINFVADGTEQTINISDGTNFIYLQKYIDNKIYTGVYDGSFVGSITSPVLTSGRKKIAFGYILNSLILYINGVSIGTDLTSTIPTCDRLSLTVSNTGSIETNNFILFPTKLTNAELASLTTI